MAAATPPAAPIRVRDELAWELVRDEWELLLAVGSGPTTLATLSADLGVGLAPLTQRVALLAAHGLIAGDPDAGYHLVPAFYERREGMSSYLRDLVLHRLEDGLAPPLAGRARHSVGLGVALATHIERAERALFPAVVARASAPESPNSKRFSVFFAAALASDAPAHDLRPHDGHGFRLQLLDVLRSAATARALDPNTREATLWVAEMRTDPEIAVEIGDLFDAFIDATPRSEAPTAGALAFAVLPVHSRSSDPAATSTAAQGG